MEIHCSCVDPETRIQSAVMWYVYGFSSNTSLQCGCDYALVCRSLHLAGLTACNFILNMTGNVLDCE